jgi:hypothetical protein
MKTYISFKVDDFNKIPEIYRNVHGLMIEDINNLAREYHVDSDNAHFQLEQKQPISKISHGTINCAVRANDYREAAKKIIDFNSNSLRALPKYTFVTMECLEDNQVIGCMVERSGLKIGPVIKFNGTPHDIFHAQKTPSYYLNHMAPVGGSSLVAMVNVPKWKSKYNR